MSTLLNTLKNTFKINSDLSFGDSFHTTGAPRREIIVGDECNPCYVTIGSCAGDESNHLIDGDIARNSDTLLQLAYELYDLANPYEIDYICIIAMYSFDFNTNVCRLCISGECFDYDNMELLIDGIKSKISENVI